MEHKFDKAYLTMIKFRARSCAPAPCGVVIFTETNWYIVATTMRRCQILLLMGLIKIFEAQKLSTQLPERVPHISIAKRTTAYYRCHGC